jgi:hypothetical protein
MSWDNDPTLLQNLILRLRTLHPTARLMTDLLTIHDGAYVVRASIHLGEQQLATGLSSAPQIEQAEDQAQLRALRSLGLQPSSPPLDMNVSTTPIHNAPPYHPPTAPEPLHHSNAIAAANGFANLPQPPHPPQAAPTEVSPDRSSTPPDIDSDTAPTSTQQRPVPKPKPAGFSPDATETTFPLDNIDRSDDIAKILIEMKRLGWSKTMGRDHLRKIYGKETRQELSDEELLDFLSFLEAQPS